MERSCSVAGCTQKHRARGLCSTHYNQTHQTVEQRHPRIATACVICSRVVRRREDSRYEPTCSVPCRTMVQNGQRLAPTDSYEWRVDAVKRARQHGCHIVEHFDREDIFDRDGWRCRHCGVQCNQPDPYDRTAATIDHVVPLHLGGDHSQANAQTLCLSCNARKADQVISHVA